MHLAVHVVKSSRPRGRSSEHARHDRWTYALVPHEVSEKSDVSYIIKLSLQCHPLTFELTLCLSLLRRRIHAELHEENSSSEDELNASSDSGDDGPIERCTQS